MWISKNTWLYRAKAEFEYDNGENIPHNIIVGDDLKTWMEGMRMKIKNDKPFSEPVDITNYDLARVVELKLTA